MIDRLQIARWVEVHKLTVSQCLFGIRSARVCVCVCVCVCIFVNILGQPLIRYALLVPNTKSVEVRQLN